MIVVPQTYQNPDKVYKSAAHLFYSCQYHIIFCPKYRRKILTPYAEALRADFLQTAEKYEFQILAMEIMPDHVHMIIDCNPRFGVERCVAMLKGRSASMLNKTFPEIKSRLPNVWTRSAFISSVGTASLDIVKQYIEEQKNK